ncbi:MAG TPA: T9SS type A sorting domain-containing protein [Flavobacteriales bacterium]|nr:T9SS type A sorting domain-containing protein [Flavobacteriales bacterium]
MWRLVLMLCLIASAKANAQVTFFKTYDASTYDYLEKVVPTGDGGFAMVGSTYTAGSWQYDTPSDVLVVRTDANGDTLWTRTYGVQDRLDAGFDITETSDGGFAIAGLTIGPNFWQDGMIMKIDGSGNWLWTHLYRGDYFANDRLLRIREMANGDLVAAGYAYRTNGNIGAYVVRTDSNGEKLWSKIYGGAQNGDALNDILPTSDGGLVLCGGTISYDVGQGDMWITKTDGSGLVEWSRAIGNTSGDVGTSVVGTDDGGFAWFGNTAFSLLLVRTDALGDTLWTRTYYITGQVSYVNKTQIDKVSGAGYIITYTSPQDTLDPLLIRLDEMGEVLWARTTPLDLPQFGTGVRSTPDGGFVMCGVSNDQTQFYPFLLKADSEGQTDCGSAEVNVTDYPFYVPEVNPVTPLITTADQEAEPAFTSHGGGTTSTICFSVGTNDKAHVKDLTMYPNPTSGLVSLSTGSGVGNTFVTVLDAMGRCVITRSFNASSGLSLDLTGHAPGVYTVAATQGGQRTVGRLVLGVE